MSAPVLSLRCLRKEYEPRVILRDVSADVYSGVTLLTGTNGAGKSTLLRILAGLERPTSGEIVSVYDTPPVYVGHAPSVYAGLSALENLRFWDRLYGGKGEQKRLVEALERVNLQRHAEDRAGAFSRGMAQRLNLARVLLSPAQVWLLDEPDTGLDAASCGLLQREVSEAKARGLAIVWISHHPEGPMQLADAVWRLENGRLKTRQVENAPHENGSQENRQPHSENLDASQRREILESVC